MAENRTEALVGAAVLAAAVGFVIYAGQVTGFMRDTGGYELRASFRSIDGIALGSEVRLAGVRVGAVTGIALNPETFFADTRLTMRHGIELPEDSAAVISSEGLMGGNYIEILPGGALDTLAPGEEIEDTQGSVSLVTLLLRAVGGGGDSGDGAE